MTFFCCHCRMSHNMGLHYEKPDVTIASNGYEHTFALCLQCWIQLAKQLTAILKQELTL